MGITHPGAAEASRRETYLGPKPCGTMLLENFSVLQLMEGPSGLIALYYASVPLRCN